MDFNKQNCLELMAEKNKLIKEGKYVQEFDKTKKKKLSQYLTLLDDDIFWQSRYVYLEIIKSYISKSIDIDKFIQKFDHLHKSNIEASTMRKENLENEIDLQLNPESRGFTNIISSIDMTIDLFDPEVTLDMNLKDPELIVYGISEEFLKINLKNNYLPRIWKYCKKS